MTHPDITNARVVSNSGTLRLNEDGTLTFENWHIDAAGHDNVQVSLIDAIINLLLDRRPEAEDRQFVEVNVLTAANDQRRP